MNDELEAFLTLLTDESETIPPHLLTALSDLDRTDMKRFTSVWKALATSRRQELIRLLGEEAEERIELLFESINRLALEDADADVRRMAIDNLWECEDPKLIPSLLQALDQDPDEWVRAAAAEALGRFVLMGQMEQISRSKLARIERLLFIKHADDASHPVHLAALESLGFSSHEDVNPVILDAFQVEDVDSKRSALKAIGRSANEDWRPQVLDSLFHKSPEVRIEAALAAGELELKDTVAPLIELLDDAHPEVVKAAIWALGHVGGKQAEESLIAFADLNEDPQLEDPLREALEYLDFVAGLMDLSIFDLDDQSEAPSIE